MNDPNQKLLPQNLSVSQTHDENEKMLGRCVNQCLNQNKTNRPDNRHDFAIRLENCLRREREALSSGQMQNQGPQVPPYGAMNNLPYNGPVQSQPSTGPVQNQPIGSTPPPYTSYGQIQSTSPYGQSTIENAVSYEQTQSQPYST
jgi:hypothetical protein